MSQSVPVHVINQAVDSLLRAKSLIDAGIKFTEEMACSTFENEEAENSAEFESCQNMMLEFCRQQRDVEQFASAAKFVVTSARSFDGSTDLEELLTTKLKELQKHNNDEDLKRNKHYASMEEHFRSRLETSLDDSELIRMSKQTQQLDEGLAVTETEINTKCPVTQSEMKHPVKNRYCGHHYDLEGAKELIRRRQNARCPVAGCKNEQPLRLEDLNDDKQLKRYIEKKTRLNAGSK